MKNNSRGYITADVSSVKDIICYEVWQITRAGNHIPETMTQSIAFQAYHPISKINNGFGLMFKGDLLKE